jgi:hypothetical protein
VAAEEKLRNSARRLFAAAHPSAGFPGRGDRCARMEPRVGSFPGYVRLAFVPCGGGRPGAAGQETGELRLYTIRARAFGGGFGERRFFGVPGGLCQSVLRRGRRCGGERSAAGPGRPYALGGLQGAAPGTAGPGVTVCGISRAELLDGMVLGRGLAGR